ncbi:MAG: hypothetical protein AB8B72_11255 [Crocinitomicaceae bacterium]
MNKKIFLLASIMIIGLLTYAQTNGRVVAKSFVEEETIILRFGTSNSALFRQGLENGYKIERFENSIDNESSRKEIIIESSQEFIKAHQKSEDERYENIISIIKDYIKSDGLDDKSEEFMFAVLLLSSSVDADFLNALGLIYRDVDYQNNTKYVYRVSINNNDPITDQNAMILKVNPKKIDKNIDFETLRFECRMKLKNVYLTWNATDLEENYAGYWIEKSKDGENFETINDIPYQFFKSQYEKEKVLADYLDTAVTEGETYFYRIRGINHFAEKGGVSNIVEVYVPKSLKGDVRIDTVVAEKFDRIITGKYLSFGAKDDMQLEKFIVFRSDSMAFGYQPLMVPNDTEVGSEFKFTVQSPLETGDRYYYKVAAISEDKDTVFSFHEYFFTLDQEPPSIPTGLKGEIDDYGIVSLNWSQNPENDIKGYRVFWSNTLKEEFVEATTKFVKGTNYVDTVSLRNLTSEIYYQIRAVDLNYNNSRSCSPVKLIKPDTIPPVPCIFRKYQVNKTGVSLEWHNSSSADVACNFLIRENHNLMTLDTLTKWSDTLSYFFDKTGVPGSVYTYKISTFDNKPNVSTSVPLSVNYETGTRLGVKNLLSIVDRVEKQIELSWEQDLTNVYSFKIYRAKNDGRYILYKTISQPEENNFIDEKLNINNVYHYKIKTVFNSGVNSLFSEELNVIY